MIKQLIKRGKADKDHHELLAPGTLAPEFSLPSTPDNIIKLSDLRGRPVILVFYPADESPVCSNQLALYNEALRLFQEYEAQILGISTDDIASHQAFAQSLKLDFPLLSDDDPPGAVARAYGAYDERDAKNERALFVLDEEGAIRWSYLSPRNVNPGANGILHALESLESKDG